MGWDEIRKDTRKCPCGVGHYTVSVRSDDWGRVEERWEMVCSDCVNAYELYTTYQSRKGTTESHIRWVPKSFMEQITLLDSDIARESSDLSSYVKSQFGTSWQRHFEGKSKKSIWKELTQEGTSYPSLPTFYAHVKRLGIIHVLESYLSLYNVRVVIDVLRLEDEQLEGMIDDVKLLQRKKEQIAADLR